MRKTGCSIKLLLIGLTLMVLACAVIWVAGVTFLGLPQATEHLGPAAPSLNPIQRTLLSIYLVAFESSLDIQAGDPSISIELIVNEGDTATEVIDQLTAAGVVNDGFLLRSYMRYRGYDVSIEAGRYQVQGNLTVRELAERLLTAQPLGIPFTVLEGWRIGEIAEALPSSGLAISPTDFMNMTSANSIGLPFDEPRPATASLEGFLFPDTYHFDPDATAEDVILTMLENFEIRIGEDIRAGFTKQGLSLYAGVTLASIVEREAVVAEEQAIIASVFLNRLKLDMTLDADPTVQYALGKHGDDWWKAPLTYEDLEFDSPYNTYLYPGLPIGPIANPGISVLHAVAFPEETPYLYFRALCDGSGRHAFAVTFEEHMQNACP